MRIGITFPSYEIGTDPGAVRAFAHAASALEYRHIVAYEHVAGAGHSRDETADGTVHGDYAYSRHPWHEPMVLFGYLAALTDLELVTAVLIAPQRQTVLLAKQAAELDLLTQGKLRLGIGTGWNAVEYEGLGVPYQGRGKRFDEQIAVLRRLWSEPFTSFEGEYHRFGELGLNPLPASRSIPLWFGGASQVALRRAAREGDGWFPLGPPTEQMRETVRQLKDYVAEAGRDPASMGIEPRVNAQDGDVDEWLAQTHAWQALGATHISLNTLDAGFDSLDQHLQAMETYKHAVGA